MEFGSWNHITHCLSAGLIIAPVILLTVWSLVEITLTVIKSTIRLMRGDV